VSDAKVRIEKLKIQAMMQEAALSAMSVSLIVSSALLKKQLSKPGTGRIYRIGKGKKGGRNLRASAAGQSPAVNTNRLRGSWSVERVGVSQDSFASIKQDTKKTILRLGSSVPYARILEYGGNTGRRRRTKIAARPYIRPNLPRIAKAIPKIFSEAIARRFR
jgi:phage gpG-like protein